MPSILHLFRAAKEGPQPEKGPKARVMAKGALAEAGKFELRAPSAQTQLDLFEGRWASDVSEVLPGVESGKVPLFITDPRPSYAAQAVGAGDNSFAGMSVLELGPLEGAHAYQIERLGAREIISVESNAEAFLKCLIVKNLVGLSSTTFVFGDVLQFLAKPTQRFDLIFCSGILYHMNDPVDLIRLMATATDKVFVWTHYFDDTMHSGYILETKTHDGKSYAYFKRKNLDRGDGRFWGGNLLESSLLRRDDILKVFANYGMDQFQIHEEDLNHPHGPCFSVSFWREGVSEFPSNQTGDETIHSPG